MRRHMIFGGMVVLVVGYDAHKLTQTQVQGVEKIPAKKAVDLSEGELEGTMVELGIQAQESTDESYLDELEKSASFHDQGLITQAEIDAKKKITWPIVRS